MKAVFFGLGGIGRRHVKLVQKLCPDWELFALRTRLGYFAGDTPEGIEPLGTWYEVKKLAPDVAFICNPTFLHIPTALECANLGMHLFIEKPIGHSIEGLNYLIDFITDKNLTAYVAYPLHFHDSVAELQKVVAGERVLHAEMVCTSDLANWRSGAANKYYSAYEDKGGGALLDVSHELYLADHLFGSTILLKGIRGCAAEATVDTDDYIDVFTKHLSGVVCNIHINLFTKNVPERWVKLHLESGRRVMIHTNPWPEEMDKAFERQMAHFVNNLGNPHLEGNLASCVPLFRKIVAFREETRSCLKC